MFFDAPQPKVQISNKKALVLLNEEKVEQVNNYRTEEGEELTETTVQYSYDGEWLPGCTKEEDALEAAKAYVANLVNAYDTSEAVNSFIMGGKKVWLDKATRVGLMNSTTIAKASGSKTTTFWFGGIKIEVDCDKAIGILSDLEMYALDCYNVTASHKAAVESLATLEDVMAYDYTQGYPDKLTINL